MSKIEWKVGLAKHKNGDECEIVHVLDNGRPVVKQSDGDFAVYWPNGRFLSENLDDKIWDLMPPRERREGYLWVWEDNGDVASASHHKSNAEKIANIPFCVERNDAGKWEIVTRIFACTPTDSTTLLKLKADRA